MRCPRTRARTSARLAPPDVRRASARGRRSPARRCWDGGGARRGARAPASVRGAAMGADGCALAATAASGGFRIFPWPCDDGARLGFGSGPPASARPPAQRGSGRRAERARSRAGPARAARSRAVRRGRRGWKVGGFTGAGRVCVACTVDGASDAAAASPRCIGIADVATHGLNVGSGPVGSRRTGGRRTGSARSGARPGIVAVG